MGMAVVVMPCFLVFVISVLRSDFFQCSIYITVYKPWLELDCGNGSGGADVENSNRSVMDFRTLNSLCNFVSDIDNVTVTVGFDLDFFCFYHGLIIVNMVHLSRKMVVFEVDQGLFM